MIDSILDKTRSQSEQLRKNVTPSQFAQISEEVETLYRKQISVTSSTSTLSLKDKLYAMPLTGYFAKWAISIVKLPVRLRQIYEDIANLSRTQGELQKKVQESRSTLKEVQDLVNSQLSILQTLNHQVMLRTEQVQTEVNEKVLRVQEQTADLESRLRMHTVTSQDNPSATPASSSIGSSFYAAFERRFRSSSSRLDAHLQNYLPFLKDIQGRGVPVHAVDLGCGRGEWLKILQSKGFQVTGVDINTTTNEALGGTGIPVVEKDALSFLEAQNKASLDLISSFHLIEHVEPAYLLGLIQQAFRVLKPGGVLILETPNPENLIVGSCNFYLDPTHRHPIPPVGLGFMVNYFGFEQLECLRFEPALAAYSGPDSYVQEISRYFSAGQDYAIVAKKPESAKDLA